MKYGKIISLFVGMCLAHHAIAMTPSTDTNNTKIALQQQSGFFRLSYDNISMPKHMQDLGFLGINYFADITPWIYGGVGAYGAVNGNQGGLFVLGLDGGIHHKLTQHWWGDAGLFVGGGGGKASLVGGGLMVKPYVGIAYDFNWARVGLHYSYISFTDGQIHSSQIGLDVDIPTNFYYITSQDVGNSLLNIDDIFINNNKYLTYQRNDFGVLLQAYKPQSNVRDLNGNIQSTTIGLVGAEFDHYFTPHGFAFIKASGAFRGIPNGYMDVLGGVGYHLILNSYGLALVPQFGLGAGGGSTVDTGGGVLIQPQLGLELPLTKQVAARISGGYLWAPEGKFKAYTGTAEVLYHLDLATESDHPTDLVSALYRTQSWRIGVFNQTYLRPQRTVSSSRSPDNLIVIQLDQMLTPNYFLIYQAASAYTGLHAGGLATGMVGLGAQTHKIFHHRLQPFIELLVGAAGGGALKVSGGAIIEPVVGLHYALTDAFGVQASVSEIKALQDSLNTPVFNIGFTLSLGTLDRVAS